MSRSDTICLHCEKPVNDGFLCQTCTDEFERDVGNLIALDRDLEITYSRQSRMGRNVGARSTARPVPWDDRASAARDAIRRSLATAMFDLQVGTELDDPSQGPWHAWCDDDSCQLIREERAGIGGVASMVAWLLGHLHRLRNSPHAGDIVEDIHEQLDNGSKICSGPALTIYAGPCRLPIEEGEGEPCGAELYVEAGYDETTEKAIPIATAINCPKCGGITDLAEQRSFLLAEIDGMLVGASTAARVLAALGIEVGSATIRKWKERGQLPPRGLDRDGHETYLISEIRALHEAGQERAEKRRAAR